jgi:hypothetical protein
MRWVGLILVIVVFCLFSVSGVCFHDLLTCEEIESLPLLGFLGSGRLKTVFLTSYKEQEFALRFAINTGIFFLSCKSNPYEYCRFSSSSHNQVISMNILVNDVDSLANGRK